MNYPKLETEVSTDPRSIGYSGMTHDQIAASLNTANISTTVPINSRQLLVWGAQQGRLDALNQATTDTAQNAATRSIAQAALHIIQRADTVLDYNDAVQAAMPAVLVAASVWTQPDINALHALSQQSVSWSSQHWGRDVTPADLTTAGI
ncbi:MAG: hypothetical protein PF501_09960 [Salinisphaera sp.]|jgi:hypothetical protein|nr:hypothetical protein [Salinisphaera sp.]